MSEGLRLFLCKKICAKRQAFQIQTELFKGCRKAGDKPIWIRYVFRNGPESIVKSDGNANVSLPGR